MYVKISDDAFIHPNGWVEIRSKNLLRILEEIEQWEDLPKNKEEEMLK